MSLRKLEHVAVLPRRAPFVESAYSLHVATGYTPNKGQKVSGVPLVRRIAQTISVAPFDYGEQRGMVSIVRQRHILNRCSLIG